MKHRKSFLGALLLSALAVCAVGAANASALTMHECVELVGTGTKYKDSKCSEVSGEGKFQTVQITNLTHLKGTLTPTTAGMNITAGEEAGTHAVLHFVAGGISVQITCTGFETPGAVAENGESGGVMKVTGSGKSKYTGCAISNSAQAKEKCKVPTELETVELEQSTEGDRVVFKPKGGGKFITIPFTSVEGKTCPAAIIGEKNVTGVARGEAASPTALHFTSESGSELKLGEIPAQFTAVIHFKTEKPPHETENTIALETP